MSESVYARAADIIRERGWTQFLLERGGEGGPVCVRGALSIAQCGSPFKAAFGTEVDERLREHLGADPASWNNDPSRTVEDVLLALKEMDAEVTS